MESTQTYIIGKVETVVPGTNITVDSTDHANPIVSSTGGGTGGDIEGGNASSVYLITQNINGGFA